MENEKITKGSDSSYELSIKRFYFPLEIEFTCPKCGENVSRDFDSDYASYPKMNEAETHDIICCECDAEFEVDIKLSIQSEVGEIKETK